MTSRILRKILFYLYNIIIPRRPNGRRRLGRPLKRLVDEAETILSRPTSWRVMMTTHVTSTGKVHVEECIRLRNWASFLWFSIFSFFMVLFQGKNHLRLGLYETRRCKEHKTRCTVPALEKTVLVTRRVWIFEMWYLDISAWRCG